MRSEVLAVGLRVTELKGESWHGTICLKLAAGVGGSGPVRRTRGVKFWKDGDGVELADPDDGEDCLHQRVVRKVLQTHDR